MRSNTILFSLFALGVSLLLTAENVSATTFAYANSVPSYSSDTVSPLPPASISAVVKTFDASSVVLSWSQASDNVGVTRYNIYRNGTFLFSPTGVGVTYIDKNVEVGQTYTYTVQSGDGAGNNSVKSNAVAIKVVEGGVSYAATSYASPSESTSAAFQETSIYANMGQNGQIDTVEAPRAIRLTSLGAVLRIEWRNPTEDQFKSVRVIKKANAFPVGIHDGVIICDGVSQVCMDTNVAPGVTYYYGVYAVNTSYLASKLVLVSGALVTTVNPQVSNTSKVENQAQVGASLHSSPVILPTSVSGEFTRTLTIGSRGEDVLRLQKFLNAQGFVLATTGPGSTGNETDYFGKGTQKAIQAYQCQNKIVCDGDPSSTGYGLVGKMTRGYLNKE